MAALAYRWLHQFIAVMLDLHQQPLRAQKRPPRQAFKVETDTFVGGEPAAAEEEEEEVEGEVQLGEDEYDDEVVVEEEELEEEE